MKDKIEKIISVIIKERENLPKSEVPTTSEFDEGFDCGTQLALDLLEELRGVI